MTRPPDSELEAAYLAARYVVCESTGRAFAIRCGAGSSDVDHLLGRHGLRDWAFVTACNPRSHRLPPSENAERMRQLRAVVKAAGHRSLPGFAEGQDGSWPPEPSLLVLGIPEPDAVRLVTRFDQHAILVGRQGEPARLVWIDESPAQ